MEESLKYLRKVGFEFATVKNLKRYFGSDDGQLIAKYISKDDEREIYRRIMSNVTDTITLYEWLIQRYDASYIPHRPFDIKKSPQEENIDLLTEALLRMGIFGVGRYSSTFNVRSLLQGSAGLDIHYNSITNICKLILVREQSARLPAGMELRKKIKDRNFILDMCNKSTWIDKSSIFPAYIDFDSEKEDIDELANAEHILRELNKEYKEKLLLLTSTERPVRQEFQNLVDQTNKVDYNELKKATKKRQSKEADKIIQIGESLTHLSMLKGKKIVERDFSSLAGDRTLKIGEPTITSLKSCFECADGLNNKRFQALSKFRHLQVEQEEFEKHYNDSKLDVEN